MKYFAAPQSTAPSPLQSTTYTRVQFDELPPAKDSRIKREKCRYCAEIAFYNEQLQKLHEVVYEARWCGMGGGIDLEDKEITIQED